MSYRDERRERHTVIIPYEQLMADETSIDAMRTKEAAYCRARGISPLDALTRPESIVGRNPEMMAFLANNPTARPDSFGGLSKIVPLDQLVDAAASATVGKVSTGELPPQDQERLHDMLKDGKIRYGNNGTAGEYDVAGAGAYDLYRGGERVASVVGTQDPATGAILMSTHLHKVGKFSSNLISTHSPIDIAVEPVKTGEVENGTGKGVKVIRTDLDEPGLRKAALAGMTQLHPVIGYGMRRKIAPGYDLVVEAVQESGMEERRKQDELKIKLGLWNIGNPNQPDPQSYAALTRRDAVRQGASSDTADLMRAQEEIHRKSIDQAGTSKVMVGNLAVPLLHATEIMRLNPDALERKLYDWAKLYRDEPKMQPAIQLAKALLNMGTKDKTQVLLGDALDNARVALVQVITAGSVPVVVDDRQYHVPRAEIWDYELGWLADQGVVPSIGHMLDFNRSIDAYKRALVERPMAESERRMVFANRDNIGQKAVQVVQYGYEQQERIAAQQREAIVLAEQQRRAIQPSAADLPRLLREGSTDIEQLVNSMMLTHQGLTKEQIITLAQHRPDQFLRLLNSTTVRQYMRGKDAGQLELADQAISVASRYLTEKQKAESSTALTTGERKPGDMIAGVVHDVAMAIPARLVTTASKYAAQPDAGSATSSEKKRLDALPADASPADYATHALRVILARTSESMVSGDIAMIAKAAIEQFGRQPQGNDDAEANAINSQIRARFDGANNVHTAMQVYQQMAIEHSPAGLDVSRQERERHILTNFLTDFSGMRRDDVVAMIDAKQAPQLWQATIQGMQNVTMDIAHRFITLAVERMDLNIRYFEDCQSLGDVLMKITAVAGDDREAELMQAAAEPFAQLIFSQNKLKQESLKEQFLKAEGFRAMLQFYLQIQRKAQKLLTTRR